MTADKKVSSTRETIAAVIAGGMVLISIIYWIVQIQGVMEMLKLAAGH